MDRVGRVVVPKDVRDRLGLAANTEFDVLIEGTGIRLQPRRPTSRGIRTVKGWPVLTPAPGHVLTDAAVQGLRDAERR